MLDKYFFLLLFSILSSFSLKAQNTYVPDDNFEQALIDLGYDSGVLNDSIPTANIDTVTSIDVSWSGITNLTGIEEFAALQALSCHYNDSLTTLNLNNNLNLIILKANACNISSLSINNCVLLEEINLSDNNILNIQTYMYPNLSDLDLANNNLNTIDISSNYQLTLLGLSNNNLTNIDISAIPNLHTLGISHNQISFIDLSFNSLTVLDVSHNNIETLGFIPNAQFLNCGYNNLTELDLTYTLVEYITCNNNPFLEYINFGVYSLLIDTGNYEIDFSNLPSLEYVCIKNSETDVKAKILYDTGHPVSFTSSCNLVPSQSNEINGVIILDIDNNGCSQSDIPMNNFFIKSTNGTDVFFTVSQSNGSFSQLTNAGNFTSSIFNLPSYLSSSPLSHSSNFVGVNNIDSLNNFCLVLNQTVNDVNISIIPITDAIPGFNTTYQLVYQNVGSTVLSGDISLVYDSASLIFLSASETVAFQGLDSLNFTYSNLNPFETRTINLNFNVFTPPTVNGGDVLNFIASINPIVGDSTPLDNIDILNQIVINAYDPNDITVYNGPQILLEDSTDYLTYRIRFQNTGTASAVNIVVENELDSLLDWSTFTPLNSSHENRIAITNGNELVFHFENILLPDSLSDEPNSHGWVFYKIKPKSNIILGDSIFSTAAIYFDYNLPVITNTAYTAIVPDNIPPIASCQDFNAYLDINGEANISVIDIDNASTDNIGITSFILSQDSFTCSDIGIMNIVMTVSDAEGNSNSCSSSVSVVDSIKPNIFSQNISIYLDNSGNASITSSDIDNGSSDNCSVSLALDLTSFDCNDLGNNTVNLTATDPSGNSRSTSASVLVEDSLTPKILANNISISIDDTNPYVISASDIDAGSSDNCDFNLNIDINSFDVVGSYPVIFSANDGTNISDTTIKVEVTKTVNIYDIHNSKISIFPNPSSSFINIRIDNTIKTQKVELFNYLGQLVMTESKSNSEINVSILPKGIYQIVINFEDSKTYTSKIRIE